MLSTHYFVSRSNALASQSADNLTEGNVLDRANSICWDKPRAATAVKFTEDDDEAKKSKVDANFVRHDTPHPKDLKARHQKLLQERQKSDEKQDQSERLDHDQNQNQSSAGNEGAKSYERTNTVTSNQSDSSGADSVIVREPDTRASGKQQSTAWGSKSSPASNHFVQQPKESVSDEADGEEDGNDSVGERTAIFIDRRVGFLKDTMDGETRVDEVSEEERNERHEKLHRRDTPHHLKNKRINVSNSKADEEKVAAILAAKSASPQISPEVLPATTLRLQKQSASPPSLRVEHDMDSESAMSNYSVPRALPSLPTGPVEIKQMKVEVIKTGSGLGLSIAGGKESSPFKGDDCGIFISRITEGGAAQAAGLLVGDKLLYVNDVGLKDVDHYKAVHILKSCGSRFVAQIEREVPINVQQKTQHLSTSSMSDIAVQASPTEVSRSTNSNANSMTKTANSFSQSPPNATLTHPSLSKMQTNGDIVSPTRHVEITIKTPPASPADAPRPRPPLPATRTSTATLTSAKSVDRLLDSGPESRPNVEMVSNLKPETRSIIFHTTLIRDSSGLGFSIRGGKDGKAFKEGTDSVYISRIAEGGAAEKDGKIRVGDKILKIGSNDVEGATHKSVVSWLMTQDRFVRLVLEREVDSSYEGDDVSLYQPTTRSSSSNLSGLYSSSYMANRPSYTGSYRRPTLGSMGSMSSLSERGGGPVESGRTTPTTPNPGSRTTYSIHTKLPGLRNDSYPAVTNATIPGRTSVHYSSSSFDQPSATSASTLPRGSGSAAVRSGQLPPARSASSHVNGNTPE